MIAAEQRLKDAGYGDKFILAQEDEDNDQVAIGFPSFSVSAFLSRGILTNVV
jgi:hypothetical protein